MIEIPFQWLDIFTNQQFKGNPAAVCIMNTKLEDSIYQNIAKELGLAETAFTEQIKENEYKLRWFTPEIEMSLCGHATMATAYTLHHQYNAPSNWIFHTLSGKMYVEVSENKVSLNFPYFSFEKNDNTRILDVTDIQDFTEFRYTDNPPAYTVIIEDEEKLKNLSIDFSLLRKLSSELGVLGLVVSCPATMPYDFAYRTFAPGAGVDEDQGTGIVQCVVAKYWSKRLGKDVMRSIQYSERVSEMTVEIREEGVRITGSVTPLIQGTLTINT